MGERQLMSVEAWPDEDRRMPGKVHRVHRVDVEQLTCCGRKYLTFPGDWAMRITGEWSKVTCRKCLTCIDLTADEKARYTRRLDAMRV